jgi:hypothetical protein
MPIGDKVKADFSERVYIPQVIVPVVRVAPATVATVDTKPVGRNDFNYNPGPVIPEYKPVPAVVEQPVLYNAPVISDPLPTVTSGFSPNLETFAGINTPYFALASGGAGYTPDPSFSTITMAPVSGLVGNITFTGEGLINYNRAIALLDSQTGNSLGVIYQQAPSGVSTFAIQADEQIWNGVSAYMGIGQDGNQYIWNSGSGNTILTSPTYISSLNTSSLTLDYQGNKTRLRSQSAGNLVIEDPVTGAEGALFCSTATTSTMTTTFINLDGNILTTDNLPGGAGELLLNGIPIATTANLSSIADWAFYPAVSIIDANNNNISSVKEIFAQNVNTSSIKTREINTSSIVGLSSINNIPYIPTRDWWSTQAMGNINLNNYDIVNVDNITAEINIYSQLLSSQILNVSTATIVTMSTQSITVSSINGIAYPPPSAGISTFSTLTTSSITLNSINGAPYVPAGNVASWATFPASSNVVIPNHNLTLSNGNFNIQANSGSIFYPNCQLDANITVGNTGNLLFPNMALNVASFNVGTLGSPANSISFDSLGSISMNSVEGVNVLGGGGVSITGGGGITALGATINLGAGEIGMAGGTVEIGGGNINLGAGLISMEGGLVTIGTGTIGILGGTVDVGAGLVAIGSGSITVGSGQIIVGTSATAGGDFTCYGGEIISAPSGLGGGGGISVVGTAVLSTNKIVSGDLGPGRLQIVGLSTINGAPYLPAGAISSFTTLFTSTLTASTITVSTIGTKNINTNTMTVSTIGQGPNSYITFNEGGIGYTTIHTTGLMTLEAVNIRIPQAGITDNDGSVGGPNQFLKSGITGGELLWGNLTEAELPANPLFSTIGLYPLSPFGGRINYATSGEINYSTNMTLRDNTSAGNFGFNYDTAGATIPGVSTIGMTITSGLATSLGAYVGSDNKSYINGDGIGSLNVLLPTSVSSMTVSTINGAVPGMVLKSSFPSGGYYSRVDVSIPVNTNIQLLSQSVTITSATAKVLIIAQANTFLNNQNLFLYATIGRHTASTGTGAINLANSSGTVTLATGLNTTLSNRMWATASSVNPHVATLVCNVVDNPGVGTWWYSVWVYSTGTATAENAFATVLQVSP